ncbi:hypothetical protein THMIRHAM_13440 [Thiomicrorhabdus immobilis]|uniref:Cytochrome C n=1 Tax=Thiomicrorhabdus immobilis TaxID=2791037 RepID=A0ABN6D0V6_9GAMM|nr:hypothetical protein [Thiomicrorhabdus immobilis]BCN93559.1 hypothetical protein THMIRHAM_13440 [Thiomicrorhabdus immobilis]
MAKYRLLFVQILLGFSFSTMVAPSHAEDTRQAIWLNAVEREVLLIEMRNFLRGSQEVLDYALKDDMALVHRTANPIGTKMLKNLPKEMTDKMPKSFYAMLKTLHYGFAEIADISKSPTAESKVVLQKLANMQKLCVGCHANFQLKIK